MQVAAAAVAGGDVTVLDELNMLLVPLAPETTIVVSACTPRDVLPNIEERLVDNSSQRARELIKRLLNAIKPAGRGVEDRPIFSLCSLL